jgi:hypothetical protein
VDPSEVQAARAPRGDPTTAVQNPAEPATSHAWHWPEHALSQQYPSVQCPVPHWESPLHEVPCAWMNVAAIDRGAVTLLAMYEPEITCEVTSTRSSVSVASCTAGTMLHVDDVP